uniref:Uncharacterized protein n=1 Tax=Arundo donax TaxID=35708 RepID=A0A0A9GDE7_ARUDO
MPPRRTSGTSRPARRRPAPHQRHLCLRRLLLQPWTRRFRRRRLAGGRRRRSCPWPRTAGRSGGWSP